MQRKMLWMPSRHADPVVWPAGAWRSIADQVKAVPADHPDLSAPAAPTAELQHEYFQPGRPFEQACTLSNNSARNAVLCHAPSPDAGQGKLRRPGIPATVGGIGLKLPAVAAGAAKWSGWALTVRPVTPGSAQWLSGFVVDGETDSVS